MQLVNAINLLLGNGRWAPLVVTLAPLTAKGLTTLGTAGQRVAPEREKFFLTHRTALFILMTLTRGIPINVTSCIACPATVAAGPTPIAGLVFERFSTRSAYEDLTHVTEECHTKNLL
jgi:hypothetical protein